MPAPANSRPLLWDIQDYLARIVRLREAIADGESIAFLEIVLEGLEHDLYGTVCRLGGVG
ncbi:MAG: hypothetical protein H0X39_02510 [Actinobacteria bacterium]|nr:hypothetical protein [Actinomycetota bacterium]